MKRITGLSRKLNIINQIKVGFIAGLSISLLTVSAIL